MKNNLLAPLLLAVISASFVSSNAFALGAINCARANTTPERILCGDESLIAFDLELMTNYQEVYRHHPDSDLRDTLHNYHTQWLAELNQCADEYCVADALYMRLDYLCLNPALSRSAPLCIETEQFLNMGDTEADFQDIDYGDDTDE